MKWSFRLIQLFRPIHTIAEDGEIPTHDLIDMIYDIVSNFLKGILDEQKNVCLHEVREMLKEEGVDIEIRSKLDRVNGI